MDRPPDASEPPPDRRARGRDDPLDVRPLRDLPLVAFEAVNRARGSRYPVYLPAAPSLEGGMCTCEDFARRGRGTCKHLEAVGLYVADHPEEGAPRAVPPVPGVWDEIDARLAALGTDLRPWSARLRWVGRALIDPLPVG
ncbi:MAG: hypothetical protein L3K03_01040 [Thermoplasmata archaeon]|nr:hypothetical protein [Thermoplasmata archaeon]